MSTREVNEIKMLLGDIRVFSLKAYQDGSLDEAIRDLYKRFKGAESDTAKDIAINAWRMLVGIHDGDLWTAGESQSYPKGSIDLLKQRLAELLVDGVDDSFVELIKELDEMLLDQWPAESIDRIETVHKR